MGKVLGDCLPDHIYQFFREDTMTGIGSSGRVGKRLEMLGT